MASGTPGEMLGRDTVNQGEGFPFQHRDPPPPPPTQTPPPKPPELIVKGSRDMFFFLGGGFRAVRERLSQGCIAELSELPPTLLICYLIKNTFISSGWNRTHVDGGTLTPLFLRDGEIRTETHAGAGQTVIPSE